MSGARVDGAMAIAAAAVGVALLLVQFRVGLTNLLANLVPASGEVHSRGTAFPAFTDALPTIVWRLAVLLMALPPVVYAARKMQSNPMRRSAAPVAVFAVVVATSAWVGWLASPHNGFPSNSRIHWVDYLTRDSDNYIYPAGRIPHLLFYDSPALWQAINAGLLAGLCVLIAKRLGFSLFASAILATVVATAGNILRFADTAEDVFINLTLVAVVILGALSRRPAFFGIALAALLLGRPQFAVIFPAVALAELVVAGRRRSWPDRDQLRFVLVTGATTLAGIVACQALFSLLGDRNFLVNGRFFSSAELERAEPIEVDGFLISAFSGSYLWHFLWVLPLTTLALATVAVGRATRLARNVETTVYFCGFSIVALLILHEATPLLYFNIRYLTYGFPFLVVMSWAAVKTFDETPKLAVRELVFVLAVLGPAVIPSGAVGTKLSIEDRPEVELLAIRSELREITKDRLVFVDSTSKGSRNYVAYVLRRDVGSVRVIGTHPYDSESIVISFRRFPFSDESPRLQTDQLLIFDGASELLPD